MTPGSEPSQANPLRDPGGFQLFYERSHLAVFRFIFGLHTGPIQEIEDLTTQVFLKAWKSRHRFHGDEKAAFSWILAIARNLVTDLHRRQRRSPAPLDIETQVLPMPDSSPEDRVARQEQLYILRGLLNQLPDQHREIITLRYLLDWRVKDIAEHLSISENHVSVLLRRVLQRLRQEWPNP